MCKLCLVSLRQKVCPFCRSAISKELFSYEEKKTVLYDLYEAPVRIRFRRRRRRVRMTTEQFDNDGINLIIETPIRKKKLRKDNTRRANWVNAVIHSSR